MIFFQTYCKRVIIAALLVHPIANAGLNCESPHAPEIPAPLQQVNNDLNGHESNPNFSALAHCQQVLTTAIRTQLKTLYGADKSADTGAHKSQEPAPLFVPPPKYSQSFADHFFTPDQKNKLGFPVILKGDQCGAKKIFDSPGEYVNLVNALAACSEVPAEKLEEIQPNLSNAMPKMLDQTVALCAGDDMKSLRDEMFQTNKKAWHSSNSATFMNAFKSADIRANQEKEVYYKLTEQYNLLESASQDQRDEFRNTQAYPALKPFLQYLNVAQDTD